MAIPPFIISQFHGLILGPTGTGKTVVANALAAASDHLRVFLNTQDKGYIRGQRIEYTGAQDNKKLASAVQGGATMLNVVPTTTDGTTELEALRDWMWPLAEGDVQFTLYLDEAQDIDPDLVGRLHKRGRDPGHGSGGIKVFSISQRFVSIPKQARTESKYVVLVGRPDHGDSDALENEKAVPFEDVHRAHSQEGYLRTTEAGETVSHAFSVVKDGEIVFGPTMAAPRYAD
jgi:hypothetical protein